MKMSLEWHKQALENTFESLARKRSEWWRLKAEYERFEREVTFYHAQVLEAEAQGKDGFDEERFMANKKHLYVVNPAIVEIAPTGEGE